MLEQKLYDYAKSDYYPFHMPGHKRQLDCRWNPYEMDITEIDGFDNLHHAQEILKQSQKRAAKLYGARKSYYLVNGSTCGLLAAICAATGKGDRILVARNCHKALYHAMYIRDLVPTYIYPHEDNVLGINGGISPARVERALEENPEIEAVFITSPTYDGVVSDVRRIADAAHKHGVPLIVDEAHGAHFRFSEYFPRSAANMGADLVIHSVHKTLPSMTQTAVLHRCTDMVDRDLLKRFLGIYQTSSPSYILMASIDACMDKLERDGRQMFEAFTGNLEEARKRLEKCRYIRLVTPKPSREMRIYNFDRSKILLSTEYSSLNGRQLHEILNKEFHLEMEMDGEAYVLALTSVGDTKEGLSRLCDAIEEIDRREAEKQEKKTEESDENKKLCPIGGMKQMMRISEAMEAPAVSCPIEETIGKVSAEFAYIYPPGIPLIVPGEQITGLFVRNVRRYMEQGLELQGLCDESNQTIKVVKE